MEREVLRSLREAEEGVLVEGVKRCVLGGRERRKERVGMRV